MRFLIEVDQHIVFKLHDYVRTPYEVVLDSLFELGRDQRDHALVIQVLRVKVAPLANRHLDLLLVHVGQRAN